MFKKPDNRLDSFIQAQIAEIDFTYEYKKIKLPELTFEEFILDHDRYFSLGNEADKWYYLKHILPRLKLLYFDNSNHITKQYLVWAGKEHAHLVVSGEYERFYIGEHSGLLVGSKVSGKF